MNKLVCVAICLLVFACNGNTTNEKQIQGVLEYTDLNKEGVDISTFPVDADGFIVLFDGKSIKGWRGYGKDYLPPKWIINQGCLELSTHNDEGGDIIFDHKFKNFILELEWKISKAGNSGIFYLAREIETKDLPTNRLILQPIFVSAPEYQLLDNENNPDGALGRNGNRKSGSLYDMIPAKPQNAASFNEWNKARISVVNGSVEHYQNGIKVAEYKLYTPEWIELLQSGKFGQTKWPLAFELLKECGGDKKEGYIGLQDHGDQVMFRHIRIRIN